MSLIRSLLRFRNKNKRIPSRRNKVHFETLEPRLLLDASGFDPKPVLVIPGFGGTMPAAETDAGLQEWLTTRGIAPDKLQVDPLANVYDNLIQTLKNVGYTEGTNLFVANWDWRVPVAPQDPAPDGALSNVTAEAITDTTYETGLDYLGYWLKQASEEWELTHPGETLDAVDIIAHSTGGLVARSYIQSDAYGATYTNDESQTVPLPEVEDLVLVGVPNEGSGDIWNILQDDFNSSIATRGAGLIVHSAWDLAEEGTPILNPDGSAMTISDHETFISEYIGAAKDLLPIFPFLDSNLDGTYETLTGEYENTLLLDLNASGVSAFVSKLASDLTVVFGTNEDTISGVQQHTGPTISLLPAVQNFDELLGHSPEPGETWYVEKENPIGDGTVPRDSAVWLLQEGDSIHLAEQTGVGHRGLVSEMNSQKAILNAVGVTGYTDAQIAVDPDGGDSGLMQLASMAFNEQAIFETLASGIGGFFTDFQEGFNSIFGNLPIIGPALADNTFFSDFGTGLTEVVALGPSGVVFALQQRVFDVLGSVLKDVNGDDQVNSDDVAIGIVDGALEFRIQLGGTIAETSEDIGFDVGLDALGLELAVNGAIDLSVEWELDLGFGVMLQGTDPSFYLVCGEGNEAELRAKASLEDGTTLTGKLAFLELTATDFADPDDIDDPQDPGDTPNPDGHTGLYGSIGIDLREPGDYDEFQGLDPTPGRLTILDMEAMMNEEDLGLRKMIAATVNAGADVNLHLVTGFDGSEVFPSIATDLDIDWDFLNIDTGEDEGDILDLGGIPLIAFNDVTLELGSFISDFVEPVLNMVGDVLDPIMPFIDMLTAKLPVITELAEMAGDIGIPVDPNADGVAGVSIYDLAAMVPDPRVAFVLTVIDFVKILNDLASASVDGEVSIVLGSFQLTGQDEATGESQDIRGMGSIADLNPFAQDIADVNAQLGDSTSGGDAKKFLKNAIAKSISFPILTDPFQAFSLLVGGNPDLFRFDMPELNFTVGFGAEFPIFPLVAVGFDGNFTAKADFDFGFDTTGIREFKESEDLVDIFNGFYLDDNVSTVNGQKVDEPEIEFSAGLIAKAGINAWLFEAGVRGGITGDLTFNLHDVDPDGPDFPLEPDGKVRVNELADRFGIAPWAIFDMAGSIDYGLDLYYWIGLDLGWFGELTLDEGSYSLASGTLVDFNLTIPDANLNLAHIQDGALILHTGPNADLRGVRGFDTDGDEAFTVSFDDGGNADPADDQLVVSAMGGSQKFLASHVTSIYAEGGAGDDKITITKEVTVPVEIYGDFANGTGTGNDRLKAGGGPSTLYGGGGNDNIYGGMADDHLYGGAGDDLMLGGEGNDELFGGGGHDRLRGGKGDDLLSAGSGRDVTGAILDDDDGNVGLASDDQLFGEDGKDTLYGSAGNDLLSGGVGDDKLYGGADDDMLRGDAGDDDLYGEGGADKLEGGLGVDLVSGGLGENIFTWKPGDGADTIDGTDGTDAMLVIGTAKDEDVEVNAGDSSITMNFDGTSLSMPNFERLSIDVAGGKDTITVFDEGGAQDIILNVGSSSGLLYDGSADSVSLVGTTQDDVYTISTQTAPDNSTSPILDVQKTGGLQLSILGGDAASGDALVIQGEAGNDVLDASGVELKLLNLQLDGGAGSDTLTTLYDNIDISGGPAGDTGMDRLVVQDDEFISDLKRNISLVASAADAGYLVVRREGQSDNIVGFEGIEALDLDLGFTNDLWIMNTIAGPTTITGGTGTEQVTVAGIQGPLAVDGTNGIMELTIDRTTDTNGLSGTLNQTTITGLGFVAPITYTGIDLLTLDLGAGADDLTISGTAAENTVVNGGGGGEEVTVEAVNNPTSVYGGTKDDDPFGSGFQDTLTVEVGDTRTLTEGFYGNLAYTVDVLRVKHLTYEPAKWFMGNGDVRVDPTPETPDDEITILSLEPEGIADHAILEGNGTDTLVVSEEASDPQSVTIEGDGVNIQHSVDLFPDENRGFISNPDQAFSTVVSPDGKNVYALDISASTLGIYNRDGATGDLDLVSRLSRLWLEESAQIVTSPMTDPSAFGCALAVSGDRLVVGASNRNSAYIFERTSTGTWTQTYAIDRSYYGFELFGASVAVDGGTVVVGAPYHQYGTYGWGSVFVYEWNGTFWSQTELEGGALGAKEGDYFGNSVAIKGNTIIVGSPYDHNLGYEGGSAYIFEKTNGQWTKKGKIKASEPAPSGCFGSSVALDGDTLIVGAMSPLGGPGSAYIFEKTNGQWSAFETDKLSDLIGSEPDGFGRSVALSGDTAIVGAPSYNPGSGSAYIFERDGESWTYVNRLSGSSTEYNFGSVVAVDGGIAVVAHHKPVQATNDGSVSVYEESGGVWSRAATLTGLASGDIYQSVAVSDNRVFAGAPDRSTPGKESDMVFIYEPQDVLSGAQSLSISPDGANLYVARPGADAITVLGRDAVTGTLSLTQEFHDPVNLNGVSEIRMSPDGTLAYAATDAGVAVLERDPATGELQFADDIPTVDVLLQAESTTPYDGGVDQGHMTWTELVWLNPITPLLYGYETWTSTEAQLSFSVNGVSVGNILLTPGATQDNNSLDSLVTDLNNLLVNGGLSNLITAGSSGSTLTFSADRTSLSVETSLKRTEHKHTSLYGFQIGDVTTVTDTPGALGFAGSQEATAPGQPPTDLTLSPDGRFLYVGSAEEINIFGIEDSGGYSNVGTIPIANPSMLAFSPDGKTLYAARKTDSAIDVFAVADDGTLALLQTVENNRNGVRGLGGVASLVVTEEYVIAAGEIGDSLVAFSRDDAGRLTYAQRMRNLYGVQGLENPNSLAISPDGAYLYVGSSGEALSPGGVAWFGVNLSAPPPAAPLEVGFSGIASLTVETGDGDDTVSVRDVAVPLTLNTNAGADTVVVHSSLENMTTEIDLGEDADTLDLRDTGSGAVTNIFGSAGEDTIRVWHTKALSQTMIEAGDGSDTIRVAGDGLYAGVDIYGDSQAGALPGNDVLEFSGQDVQPAIPPVGTGTVWVNGFQPVSYSGIEEPLRLLNALPVADAGDQYTLPEGGTLTIDASGSDPRGQAWLKIEWDINGDGEFGDMWDSEFPTDFSLSLSWADLQDFGIGDDGTYTVALRVTTDVGFDESIADVTIGNVAPTPLLIPSGGSAYEGRPYALNLSSSDPGDDTISQWTINWGDSSEGETIRGNPSSVTHLYTSPGNYNITGSATDEDGIYAAGNTVSIEVLAVTPPQIVGDASTAEGSPYTLELDPGEHIVDWWFVDWGDGSPKQTVEGAAGQLTHTFLNDGSTTIAATAVNQYGRAFDLSIPLSVDNVAPTANAGGPYTILEGADLVLSGNGSDPSPSDNATLTFSWDLNDDGTFGDATGASPTLKWAALKALGMNDDGTYTATLRVSDDDTWTDATADLTIANVAPTAALSGPAETTEGSEFALTIGSPRDPGNDRITQYIVNWGDNSTETVAAPVADENGFIGSSEFFHTYADGDSDHTVSIQLVDEDGTWRKDETLNIHVKNVAPNVVAESHNVTVDEGQRATNAGTFYDAGDDVVTLTASLGTITQDSTAGTWVWSFDTSDGPNDSQSVTITATDSDGASMNTGFDLIVKNLAPQFDAGSDATLLPPVAGAFSRSINFTDPGQDTWSGKVNFGDGTEDQPLAIDQENKSLNLSYIYADEGTHDVKVTVWDDDGGSYTDSFKVEVFLNTPPVADAGGPYTINEGSMLTLDGSGSSDLESDILNWEWDFDNDGQYDYASPGATTTYTWTDNGSYTVALKVTDSYGEFSTDTTVVSVNNVAPALTLSGDAAVNEGSPYTLNLASSDPGADTISGWQITWGDGNIESVTGNPPSVAHVYADGPKNYEISATATDEDGTYEATNTVGVSVENVAPTVDAGILTQTVQYSDPIDDVIFAATDASSVDTMNAVTSYSFNGSTFANGLPDALTIAGDLSFSGDSDQVSQATWTLSGIADLAPGTYVIRVTVMDDDGSPGSADTTIIVEPEDARSTYVGPLFVSTPSVDVPTAVVQLRAVIQDVKFYPDDPNYDLSAGDITQAIVKFITETGATIASGVPVKLIDPADPLTGVAVYDWLVDLGTQYSDSIVIRAVVEGYYSRNNPEDSAVITVSKPMQDFITGGGYLINENSAGTYAGDDGLKTNFGFNVKFNKNLTNLQGKVNAIIRKDGHVYQIKTNAAESLVVDPITHKSTFTSKANLMDITDPLNPISMGGNLSLIVNLTDNGEPGTSDSISFTLWKNNTLWFSSNWTGVQTAEQVLGGGNLVVRAGGQALQTAAGQVDESADGQVLTQELLTPIVEEAIARWADFSVGSECNDALEDVKFQIADLSGSTLGLASGNTVWIDVDAAGYGWFIDPTPSDNREFKGRPINGELTATAWSPALGEMDLLTAVMHELGHVLGYEDLYPETHSLMSGTLGTGERHIAGDAGNPTQENSTRLVVMEPVTDVSLPATLAQTKSSWLSDFLVNGTQNSSNAGDPNSGIQIMLFEGPKGDSNSLLRSLYGKKARR